MSITTENREGSALAGPPSSRPRASRLTARISVVVLVVAYLSLALTFSLLTRAWEADDEVAHTQYIEYIIRHDSLPHISAANGIESHQPPLYYLVTATWQHILGIPAFTPDFVTAHYKNPYETGRLVGLHNYTPAQHREAVYLHELRLLSIVLGLGTVLMTYAGAKVVGLREPLALSAGLFVALLPRELVVSSDVTNDALVIPLCSLALLCFLLAERARWTQRLARRRLWILGMGLALGAAVCTKFDSLPVAAVLLALAFVPSLRLRRRSSGPRSSDDQDGRTASLNLDRRLLPDGFLALLGFFAVSGWWFIRNKQLYGQFLATRSSEDYLRALVFLHPVPWTSSLIFNELPSTLWLSMWYLQPNLVLPHWISAALSIVVLLTLAAGAGVMLVGGQWRLRPSQRLSAVGLLGCIVAGVIAVVIVIKSVGYGDARLAYVGLSAFAIVLTAAMGRILSRTPRLAPVGIMMWPAALFALDMYVIAHFLVPLGGL